MPWKPRGCGVQSREGSPASGTRARSVGTGGVGEGSGKGPLSLTRKGHMATHGHAVTKQLSPYLSECRKEDGRESKAKAAEGDQGPSWACGGRVHSPAVRAPSRRAGRGPLPNTTLAGSQLTCRQLDSGWNPFAVGNRRRHTTFKRQLSPPGPPPSKREPCSVDSGRPGPGRNGAAGPQDRRAPGPERATGRFLRGAAGPPARPSPRTRPASPHALPPPTGPSRPAVGPNLLLV